MHYTNVRSAMAEEGILRLLLLDDSLFPAEPPLRENDFSSPLLGKVFTLLWRQKEQRSAPKLTSLAGELSGEEMSHVTNLCQKPESVSNGRQALADYIAVVRREAEKRAGADMVDPLLAVTEKFKDQKKSNGGKQHG
ncbi:hypothetical protein SDC9_133602 [bioreactor metagenome]|uniref:Uncharacterized protein n=1 Tax=bioreactor metagenome TaxID=1076179 RepID=A0A645DC55_9ZZZZ